MDAYLQMLIEQNELLDKKIDLTSCREERDGLNAIKSNLDSLLASIKHAIVLLQIAKVSLRSNEDTNFSSKQSSDSSRDRLDSVSDSLSRCSNTNNIGSSNNSPKEHEKAAEQEEDDEDETFFDAADDNHNNHQLYQSSHKSDNLHKVDSILINSTAMSPSTNNDSNNGIASVNTETAVDWDALYEAEEEDLGSLENHGSVIKHLMSQIRIGMDLTKVVLPTFILERRSLLEMYADFFAHPDLFSAIPDYETPEERMIQLVKWYLSAFHAGRKSSVAKKPYNPVLGEIFLCHWNLNSDNTNSPRISNQTNNPSQRLKSQEKCRTSSSIQNESTSISDIDKFSQGLPKNSLFFVAEQVSHHPPVSAFYAENSEKLISCTAHIYTKSKYLGLSVGVHNIGQGVIRLLKHNETYVCTFPSAYGRSILTVPWIELGGAVEISCRETGYTANIEFVTKPFYGGKKHRVIGEVLRPNREPIMSVEGEWNGCIYSKSPPNSGERRVFVDTTSLPPIEKRVRSISEQEPFESRNVWKEVTRALKARDVNSATAAKSVIEQRQRDSLKTRTEKGFKWKTRYFEAVDDGERWDYSNSLEKKALL